MERLSGELRRVTGTSTPGSRRRGVPGGRVAGNVERDYGLRGGPRKTRLALQAERQPIQFVESAVQAPESVGPAGYVVVDLQRLLPENRQEGSK